MKQSIEFEWNTADFEDLLRCCQFDDAVQSSLKWLNARSDKILEAGCGSGRVVKYLYDRGYTNIYGIELNESVVTWINKTFPMLNIIAGDLLNMPYESNYFDVVLSYGVVEHFPKGLSDPLKSIFSVLKPGGTAIITVPSLNLFRQINYWWNQKSIYAFLKNNPMLRRLLGKEPVNQSNIGYLYRIHPMNGPFFEYRLTPQEFEEICISAGFEIMVSKPISQVDGLFHLFGPPLVDFNHWQFTVSPLGKAINALFSQIPFLHNHMHFCALRKPLS